MPNPNRKDERPTVGPADDATRRRMLAAALGEKDPGTYSKPLGISSSTPESSTPAPADSPTLLNAAAALKNRGKQIDQAVDDAT